MYNLQLRKDHGRADEVRRVRCAVEENQRHDGDDRGQSVGLDRQPDDALDDVVGRLVLLAAG